MNIVYNNFIAVTNRHILKSNITDMNENDSDVFAPGSVWYNAYLEQIEKIASLKVCGIVLREKDLPEDMYRVLAKDCISICEKHKTLLILHSFLDTARKLDYPHIHLPLDVLKQERRNGNLSFFETLGTSIHSLDDALLAEDLDVSYIFAGNIFETACKKGLPGRGLSFLKSICKQSSLPVFAIGGVTTDRLDDIMQTGATGACMMSGFMKL